MKDTYALHCFVALAIAGPLPVTQKQVGELTGIRDDEAISVSLRKLETLGLAVCTGSRHKTGWALTANAPQSLPLPLNLLSEAPAPTPVKPESDLSGLALPPAPTPVKPESDLPGKQISMGTPVKPGSEIPESESFNKLNNDSRIHHAEKQKQDPELERQLYQALDAANVYHQLRQTMVAHFLADDDPRRWLRSLLGWICFAIRDGASSRNKKSIGQRVYPMLTLRDGHRPEHSPDDCLPPENLPFGEALAWALAGGPAASDPEAAPELEFEAEPALPMRILTPAEQIWTSSIQRFRVELGEPFFRNWLSDAIPVSYEVDVLTVGVRNQQARDYLSRVAVEKLQRALFKMTSRNITVKLTIA